jgi:CheY-like chemotaxis protein
MRRSVRSLSAVATHSSSRLISSSSPLLIPPAHTRAPVALCVLAIDDEADARHLIKRILVGCGAQVETADSGAAALRYLRRTKPDVLIADIGMPGEDGYTVMRNVRQLPTQEGGNTPAIALTAFARSEDRRRAVLNGFQMHIAKPVEPSELIAMVASLAGRTR